MRQSRLLSARDRKLSTDPSSRSSLATDKIFCDNSTMELPIVDFGPLQKAVIVSRPCSSIKSPYIADIIPLAEDEPAPEFEKSVSIPSGGLESQRKIDGARTDFLRRSGAKTHLAHAPALDCAGMVIPGSIVYCTANDPRREVIQ
jgi:hypothetical protein